MQTDGSPSQPTKLFQFVAVVGIKQLVSAKIS
jgi:hypothetical protein